GILPVARRVVRSSRRARPPTLVVPPGNVPEAGLVSGLPLSAPASLVALVHALRNGGLTGGRGPVAFRQPVEDGVGLAGVGGQHGARRALEVTAAGGHALLMIGPPGAGKTMLARRLPTILPRLGEDEALEVVAIHSVAGLLPPGVLPSSARPFRA